MFLGLVMVAGLMALTGTRADIEDRVRDVDSCLLDPSQPQCTTLNAEPSPEPTEPPPSPEPEFVCFVPYCDGCDVGNVDISIFFDGETFSVTCMEGLEMAGDPIITCSRDLGGWDHIPECREPTSPVPTTTTPATTPVPTCPLPEIENTEILANINNFKKGQILSVRCQQGYMTYFGNFADPSRPLFKLRCEENQQWSGETPVCRKLTTIAITTTTVLTPRDCLKPVIENAVLTPDQETYMVDENVQVTCEDNAGNVFQITCGNGQEWIGPMPECKLISTTTLPTTTPEPMCYMPEVVNADISPITEIYRKGQVIDVRCEEGHATIISEVESDYSRPVYKLTCSGTDTWLGIIPDCRPFTCEKPILSSGVIVKVKTGKDKEVYDHGDRIFFQCREDYQELVGNTNATCDMGRVGWNRRVPVCRSTRCPSLRWPSNGRLHGDSYNVGDNLRAFCYDGFTLSGTETRTCLKNGSWSGIVAACQNPDYTCPDPGIPDGGYREGDVFVADRKVKFSCDFGYIMTGAEEITCRRNGSWSQPPTKCIGPNMYMDPELAAGSFSKMALFEEQRYRAGESRDIFFFLDTSGSVSLELLNAQKYFFDILSKRVHHVPVSLISYNETAQMVKRHTDLIGMHAALEKVTHLGGGTSFKDAFRLGFKTRSKARTFVIITNDVMDQNGRLTRLLLNRRKNPPYLYIIGVGGHSDRKELSMAIKYARSMPLEDHLFFLKEAADLKTMGDNL